MCLPPRSRWKINDRCLIRLQTESGVLSQSLAKFDLELKTPHYVASSLRGNYNLNYMLLYSRNKSWCRSNVNFALWSCHFIAAQLSYCVWRGLKCHELCYVIIIVEFVLRVSELIWFNWTVTTMRQKKCHWRTMIVYLFLKFSLQFGNFVIKSVKINCDF